MSRSLRAYYFGIFLRVTLGIIFIVASYYKITSPGAFAHQIYNYKLLPTWAINPLAIILPWIQLYCGIMLVVGRFSKGASVLILAMLIVFQLGLGSALIRGLNVSCGCFKSGGDPATWLTFGRDTLILLAALLNFWHVFQKVEKGGLWMARRWK